ncbi:MAG: lamin tail domain-containing protein [Gammaproteobacteria bacterium]|nr:lamin tail domain-containing protein [Gammaproteobacteria bacterium]
MSNQSLIKSIVVAGSLFAAGPSLAATVAITEWMYAGSGGEFIEFTNVSGAAIDFTGWSYDDDSRLAGVFDLSGFGVVAAGESVIITESSAAQFSADWSLASSIKVLGGYTNNLGRNDEINLFDVNDALVDRLTYGDQTFAGTIRTQGASGSPLSLAALGANDPALWALSTAGDQYGSYLSANADLGNPGTIGSLNPVPVPAAVWLLGSALAGLIGIGRRKA